MNSYIICIWKELLIENIAHQSSCLITYIHSLSIKKKKQEEIPEICENWSELAVILVECSISSVSHQNSEIAYIFCGLKNGNA